MSEAWRQHSFGGAGLQPAVRPALPPTRLGGFAPAAAAMRDSTAPIRGSDITDAELVARAQQGSQDAFREIVSRYQRPVFNLVQRIVRDAAAAEDVAQEAFVKVYRALATYEPSQKLSSWIFKISHNAAIDSLRRRPADTVPLEGAGDDAPGVADVVADTSSPSPEAAALRGDLRRALDAGLDRLRPEYRTVLVLRFQEELAYEEIAEVTGLPLGTVKTHIHRARKELATVLQGMGWGRAAAP